MWEINITTIEVASDGNRRILSDAELLNLFPNGPGYPPGAYATRPQSINHLLPITLRTLNFRLTDVDGNEVNTRGTSVSFAIFLDPDK